MKTVNQHTAVFVLMPMVNKAFIVMRNSADYIDLAGSLLIGDGHLVSLDIAESLISGKDYIACASQEDDYELMYIFCIKGQCQKVVNHLKETIKISDFIYDCNDEGEDIFEKGFEEWQDDMEVNLMTSITINDAMPALVIGNLIPR